MCFEYDGVWEFYESKRVKCRKPHRCGGCRKTIAAKEYATRHSGKFEGDLICEYECDDCKRLTLSIAAEEMRHGCHWSESWCALSDLREYIAERGEPVPLLNGTIDECIAQVNAVWDEQKEQRRKLLSAP